MALPTQMEDEKSVALAERITRPPLAPVVLIVIGLLTYANSLSVPFLYDDNAAIIENGDIRHVWPLWRTPQDSDRPSINSRPVVRLSLALNYVVGGLDVRGYHVVNLSIHIGCALLLFGLTRRMLRSPAFRATYDGPADGISFMAALLWLVHPLNSQCVNYVTQRSESLVALFYLAMLYGLARAAASGDRRWSGVAIATCCLGMGAKEVMVTAPVMAWLYDRTFIAGSVVVAMRRRWRLYGALAGTWLLLAGLLWSRPHGDSVGFNVGVGPLDYALNQTVAILHYLRLSVWPDPLVLDYGYVRTLALGDVAAELLIIAMLLAGTGWALVRHPGIGFAGAWFFVILAPTSSFVPLIGEVAAERRVYLSLMALVVMVVTGAWWAIDRLRPHLPSARPVGIWLGIGVAVTLATLTIRRNEDFSSVESVWRTVVAARPDNPRGHSSLGAALADEGRLKEALEYYETALSLSPTYPAAHYNKANALLRMGDAEGAVDHFRMCLTGAPEDELAPLA